MGSIVIFSQLVFVVQSNGFWLLSVEVSILGDLDLVGEK